jgi:acetyl-CoA synthetase
LPHRPTPRRTGTRARRRPRGFWAEQADRLTWAQKWDKVLEWDAPFAKWFVGGKLNVAVNCVDRHVEAGHGEQVAFHWEGEPGDSRTITYADLQREVCKAANALTELGVQAGDRVAIQMPMIPEAAIAMLACARLGAMHSVVFGGFSPGALKARIEDAEAKLLITTDGQYRRGKPAPMKENTDQAVAETSTIEHVLVVRAPRPRCRGPRGRDVWWHDVVERQSDTHEAEAFDSENPLFILYTSGTTGKPKGILHTSAATSPRCATRTTSCSTTSRARASTGAPPTSAGSPGTATSSTGRWPTGPRR